MRTDIDDAKEDIILKLTSGISRAQICVEYKVKYDTLKLRLDTWGISTKNQQRKGLPHYEGRKKPSEYLIQDSKDSSHRIKLRLWRDKLKPEECEICGWHMKSKDGRLPLELHHINGNHWDNRIENLLILCPNCHSLEPGNSGASIGKYKAS
jgi:hypothetical protein